MKKMWLLTSMLCSMLLMAGFAAAEVSGDYSTWRHEPTPTVESQRLITGTYNTWFSFDQQDRPKTQRILDPASLQVYNGDLATPARAGAQRILTDRQAWMYGYDLTTGQPLLDPYGEVRILKANGFGGTPLSLEPGQAMQQMTERSSFRARRARTMNLWLARMSANRPIIKRYSQYPVTSISSEDNLDTRPVYYNSYEYLQGYRDMRTDAFNRQVFLRSLPGTVYSEIYERAGSGEMGAQALLRQQFVMHGPGIVVNDLGTRFGGNQPLNSNILLRDVFNRNDAGLRVYDRYPDTRAGSAVSDAGIGNTMNPVAAQPSAATS